MSTYCIVELLPLLIGKSYFEIDKRFGIHIGDVNQDFDEPIVDISPKKSRLSVVVQSRGQEQVLCLADGPVIRVLAFSKNLSDGHRILNDLIWRVIMIMLSTEPKKLPGYEIPVWLIDITEGYGRRLQMYVTNGTSSFAELLELWRHQDTSLREGA